VNVEELLQGVDAEGAEADEATRPPVVTVMGHVDHGKTSLLDAIRSTNVVASESGGITQHIGAYMVQTSHGEICFLDTPGHAAFTAMRSRGAQITDIAVLVVAADDGVMPQTLESINHAKAAGVPVIVAVNKIDKPGANPDRVKQQLSEHGLQPEDWGGDTQFVSVSALKRTGIDDLLEAISLQSQILELSANADRAARGTVIEARLDKGRGPVATILVQQGTLRHGDFFVVGETTGRVRAMMDYRGASIREAGPSHPVEILGLEAVPQAGDGFDVVEDSSRAAQVADHRRETTRKSQQASTAKISLEDFQRQVAAGETRDLKVIIKTDVHGSAEAMKQALEKLSTSEVTLTVIHTGVGAINESDIQLGMASNAIVIGFHVRPEGKARTLAEREGVDVRLHTVIYEAIDEVRAALEGLLAPDYKEVSEGRAEVRQTFTVPGGNVIAGSYVTDGKVTRNARCRLLRDNVVVHEGKVGSLRRFKDDVREVQSGYECGIGLDRFNDLKPGDVIECFRLDEIKRTLGDRPAGSAAGAQA
jgi:translation initiation factor IF-2